MNSAPKATTCLIRSSVQVSVREAVTRIFFSFSVDFNGYVFGFGLIVGIIRAQKNVYSKWEDKLIQNIISISLLSNTYTDRAELHRVKYIYPASTRTHMHKHKETHKHRRTALSACFALHGQRDKQGP